MRSLLAGAIGLAVALVYLGSAAPGAGQDVSAEFIARTNPRTPAEEQKTFHLPPGFEIQLVAAEPDIIKPINMNFDDRGRLWVTQSVEYPFPAPPNRKARDTVKIFEDFGDDGRARKVTTFVDGLNIPIGILPIPHGAIVYSIPDIYRFTDSHGDDHADRRQKLYGSIGYRDTHGMTSNFTWGFDGWIYACHGFANHSVLRGADGSVVAMDSGNTYRMKPDGSHVEQFTHGQVNPFGLCFDPLGNLYSADCHTRPIMMLQKNGYYQSFGKPHEGLGFAPEMCDHDHGSTAIAGIVYYAADQFPPAYRDTVFVGNVVTNRINHDRLERHGSSLKAIELPDFVICDDPWFRPVNLLLGPDGAMYVADFYNRIIGHYEVPLTHPGRDHTRGRIWRIVYRGPEHKRAAPPRADWGKAAIPELVDDLAHPNLAVRFKATNQLVERGGPDVRAAVAALMQPKSQPFQRMHGLWVLERLHALDDRTLEAAAHDSEPGVRVHAMRVLTGRKELSPALHELAVHALKDPDGFVQRTAADALGAHPAAENVAPLLVLRHSLPADDFQLLYAVRMALRDQLRPTAVWAKLSLASWSEADTQAIADVAVGVHSAEAARFLLGYVRRTIEKPEELTRYVHHIARFGDEQAVRAVLDFARGQQAFGLQNQAALFKAIQQGTQERGGQLSESAQQWAQELTRRLLDSGQADSVLLGTELAGAMKMKAVQDRLVALAGSNERPEAERKGAVDALAAIDAGAHFGLFFRVLGDPAQPLELRKHVASLLAGTNKPEAQADLLKVLAVAPAPVQSTIAAGLADTPQGAARLLDAVAAGKASARLLQEWWVHIKFDKYADLRPRLAKLTEGLPTADQRLQELIQRRRKGYEAAHKDAALGVKVFEKNCAICHQIAGKGAKIGPQLDGIGVRGVDRLLEDILDPNRNVDQAFRATTLVLKTGQIVSGLVLRVEGEVIVLADAQGKEVRVPKSNVQETAISMLSPMPANLAEQIPEPDFYNLLDYLLAQRPTQGTQAGK